MTKFIEITTESGDKVFVNVSRIESMTEHGSGTELWMMQGGVTKLWMASDDETHYVAQETIPAILAMIDHVQGGE